MGIEFFDKVFVINLPHRTDRLDVISKELHQHGIEFEVWKAVEGPTGIIGLCHSMKALFNHALEKGYKNIMVLEDDSTFLLPSVPFLKEVIPQLPKDYHCLFLGLNLLSRPTMISNNILKVRESFSTHAVCYSETAMRLILPLLENPAPYDILLRNHIQCLEQCYCTFPMLATQRDGYSDIENKEMSGEKGWGKLMATTYAMHTKFIAPMSTEIIYCGPEGHKVNGVVVTPFDLGFDGKVCDCKKIKFVKGQCDCGNPTEEIKQVENVDA